MNADGLTHETLLTAWVSALHTRQELRNGTLAAKLLLVPRQP
jgi:hypothetical protein